MPSPVTRATRAPGDGEGGGDGGAKDGGSPALEVAVVVDDVR
jgi:hypothetical protein